MGDALAKDLPKRINEAHGRAVHAAQSALLYAREAGQLLTEAKEAVPHGQWGQWIEEHVTFSARTARGYMRIADRWDELPTPENGNALPIRTALAALAEPREPDHDVASDSAFLRKYREIAERHMPALSPHQTLYGKSGEFSAMIEPAVTDGYYYVSIVGPEDEHGEGWVRGTIKPTIPTLVAFYLEEEYPEGRFDVERARWTVRPVDARHNFNRWLWDSHEEYVEKHILGHTLPNLDAAIGRGLETVDQVEAVLRTIRDKHLYRDDFETFDDYLNTRWPEIAPVVNLSTEESPDAPQA